MNKALIISLVVLAILATGASGQVQVGESSMNLNGNVFVGYNGDYSNFANSDHGIQGGGTADLSGYYYNPNFLSFNVQPFYNQSRANSDYQSITAATGVNASAGIFSGSHFPGSISFTKTYNNSGNYSLPGLADYITHGDTEGFAATWGVHLEDLPTLNLSFAEGNNNYSLFGLNTEGTNHYDTFSAMSSYRLAGFSLNGGYQYTSSHAMTPQFVTSEAPLQSDSEGSSLSFGVGHALPLHGAFFSNVSRSTIDTSASGYNYNTTIDSYGSGVSFIPIKNLSAGANVYYNDNLEGSIYNSLVGVGAFVPTQASTQQSSNDLSFNTYANYDIPAWNLHLRGGASHQEQSFEGESFAANVYNGAVTYSSPLLGGFFTGVMGLTRTSVSPSDQSMLGMNTSVNYQHNIQRWSVSGSASYSQDTQTILLVYTTSGYNYSGSVGRRLGRRSYWGASASGARSVLTDQPGTANASQSYSTSLNLPHVSLSGSYSKSSGNALLTSTGLVPTPVPLPIIAPSGVILYNGSAYSVGIGSSPIHGLTISGTFAKALSGTQSILTNSNNSTENLNFYVVYKVRKLDFTGGYEKLNQGFSLSGTPPTMVGSFFVGISRWFNFF